MKKRQIRKAAEWGTTNLKRATIRILKRHKRAMKVYTLDAVIVSALEKAGMK